MACYTAGVAQVPPPFTPQQPAKPKSNTTLIVVIILAVVGLPCVAVIALVGFGAKVWNTTLSPMAGCMLSITEIRNATLTYAEQNGGKLPAAKTWQDDVRPFYSKQMELTKEQRGPIKLIPAEGEWACVGEDGKKSYIVFNSDLSSKLVTDIEEPRDTILIFESEKGGLNASEPYKKRPKSTSPKIFGSARGWIEVPVKGEPKMDDEGKISIETGGAKVKIDTGEEPPPAAPPAEGN